jgi:FkbM family methyltransferase
MWEVYQEERFLPNVLKRLLTPNSNVLDVGCHIGSFISLAAGIAREGHHTVIEPSPEKAALLTKKFPSIRVEQVAVSDAIGTANFEENLTRSGYSKLADGQRSGDETTTYQVKVVTLDALNLGKVDFVKIDIEGAELSALKGAPKFIEANRPKLIFECGAAEPRLDRMALFDYVTDDLSYDVFTYAEFLYEKGPLGRDEFRKCGIYPFRAFNFVALPRCGPRT